MNQEGLDPAKAIAEAKAKFPDLGPIGLNSADRHEEFNHAEVLTAMEFLSRCRPTKVPNNGSYGLKHSAEDWGHLHGMRPYITNGALIAAAVGLGFAVERFPHGGPNACIGVNEFNYRKLREETKRQRR